METLALRIIDYPDAETSPDHPNQWPCKGCWSYAGPTGLSVVARRIEGGPALTRRPGFEYPFEAGYSIRQSARFPDTNGYRQLFHTGGQHYHIHTHGEGVGPWETGEGWLSYGYCRKIDLTGEKPYFWTGVSWATNSTVWRPVFLRFTWMTSTNTMRVEVSIGKTTPSADLTYELAHDPTGTWDAFERPVATDGILEGWFSAGLSWPSWGPDFRDNDLDSRFAGARRPPMAQLPKIGQSIYSTFDMLDRWLPEGGLHDLSAGAYAHQWAENINGGPDVNHYSYTGLRIFRNDLYYNGTLNKFGFSLADDTIPFPLWEGYYTADIPDTYVLMDASNDNTITLSLQSTNYGTPPASISYRWRKLGDQLPPFKTAADYAATDEIILGDHDGESLRLPKKLTCSLTGLQHLSAYPATDVNTESLDDYPWIVDDVPPLLWTQSTSPYGEMAGAWNHSISHLVAAVETDLRSVPFYLVAHATVRVQIISTNTDANGDSYRIVSEIPCSLLVFAAQFDPLHISIEWVPPYADAPYSAGWRYILYQAEVARGDSLTSIPNSITASEAGHYDLTAMTVHIGYGGSLTLSS
jgi:hypothetical protein